MDCKTARLLLDFASPLGPAELDVSEAEALDRHLQDCPDCAALALAQRQEDDVIGRAMRDVPVPPGLHDRLLAHLDAERDAGYRRLTRRWIPVGLAAAVLLAASWFGVDYWQQQHRPKLKESAIAELTGPLINPTHETVQAWFWQTRRIDTAPPKEFNYALLTYYDQTEIQGKVVPMLLFTQGKGQARVYILSDRQFDIQDLLANPPSPPSICSVEVKEARPEDSEGVHFAYLILYTTETLDPFLEKNVQVVN
jgi:hypothetical protein